MKRARMLMEKKRTLRWREMRHPRSLTLKNWMRKVQLSRWKEVSK